MHPRSALPDPSRAGLPSSRHARLRRSGLRRISGLASAAALAFALTLPSIASAGILFVPSVTASTGDLGSLALGDTFTIEIQAVTDTQEALALGLRVLFDDTYLAASDVVTPTSIFNLSPSLPFGGISNTGNGLAGTISPSGGGLPANVNLFQGVALVPAAGTGALEGNQFSVTFTVIAAGAQTTIDIGAFAEFADTYAGGDNAQTPASLSLVILPEPGTALLIGLGLAGLARTTRLN